MAGDETEYIELKVVDQDNSEIHFRMQRTTKMEKLKRCYSEKVGVPVTSLTFLFYGRHINNDDTPMALEMVQADEIEVFGVQREKLSNVSAELLSSRSDREGLEKALEWTKNSLDKVTADVARVEEARSSLSKNKCWPHLLFT